MSAQYNQRTLADAGNTASPDNRTLSVVIVSWNCREVIGGCLESVRRAAPEAKVFVVDNASRDGTPELVAERFPEVRLIRNERNLGFGPGNNVALRMVETELALVLNPDTVVDRTALERCVLHAAAHPEAGLVTCRVTDEDGALKRGNFRRLPSLGTKIREELFVDRILGIVRGPTEAPASDWEHLAPFEVEAVPGAFMLLRMRAGRQIGFFDEELFLYAEDTDLCKRLRDTGWRIDFVPAAGIRHVGGQSTAKAVGATLVEFYRSEDHYFRKHHPRALVAYRIVVLLSCMLRGAVGAVLGFRSDESAQRGRAYRKVAGRYLQAVPRGAFFRQREVLGRSSEEGSG